MTINSISYTFSGIYNLNKSANYSGLADKSFLRTLFGDPVNTIEAVTETTISCTIEKSGLITHRFEINNSNRIMVLATSTEMVASILKLVTDKFLELNGDSDFHFTNYGISYDYEILNVITEGDIGGWLFSKTTKETLNSSTDFVSSSGSLRTLEYLIKNSEDTEYVINIQPRANNFTAVYYRISELHREVKVDSSLQKELDSNMKKSEEYIRSISLNLLK